RSTKKGSNKANLFQPTALLNLVVYHNELKQLQRIREFQWGYVYDKILTDVRRNAIALYLVELFSKCVKQPESNPDLYHFVEDIFMHLDKASDQEAANFPLFFSLHLPVFFGFRFQDNYNERTPYLDLQEGLFTDQPPMHNHYLDTQLSS